jgi:hypothetical protein
MDDKRGYVEIPLETQMVLMKAYLPSAVNVVRELAMSNAAMNGACGMALSRAKDYYAEYQSRSWNKLKEALGKDAAEEFADLLVYTVMVLYLEDIEAQGLQLGDVPLCIGV